MILVEGFLIGAIAVSSLTAGVFFLKFWKRTRDSLFLSFGIAFLIEGLNRIAFLFVQNPSEGSPAIYIVRLCVFLLILGAILKKNYGERA